jgi:hypothetical protein
MILAVSKATNVVLQLLGESLSGSERPAAFAPFFASAANVCNAEPFADPTIHKVLSSYREWKSSQL